MIKVCLTDRFSQKTVVCPNEISELEMVLKRASARHRISPGEFKTMKEGVVGVNGAGGGGVVDVEDAAPARSLEIDRIPARASVFYRQELLEELPVLYMGASTVEALEPALFGPFLKKD